MERRDFVMGAVQTALASAMGESSPESLPVTVGEPISLWAAGSVPGARGVADADSPTITPYLPPSDSTDSRRAAMVICPGGGYGGLAPHEGNDYALFLAARGIACFVLKYRLAPAGYKHPAMLQDVTRALRTVRSRAAEWRIEPTKIGVMGSSAGGHLASTLLTHFDSGQPESPDKIERASSRPDFGVLCYPVISMQVETTHAGSRRNLLGETPDPALVELVSNERRVTAQTPPCFLWHTFDDSAVKVENVLLFAAALRKNNVPFDLHVYQKGAHGLGLGDRKPPFENPHPWAADLIFWLKAQGLVLAAGR